jgi:hypothetical protein
LNIEDIQLQVAGILANLSELHENQVTMVEESACVGLLTLAFAHNDEIQQDTARALANLCSNEDIHLPLYKIQMFNVPRGGFVNIDLFRIYFI